MSDHITENTPVISPLEWDSRHFGIRCGKAVLTDSWSDACGERLLAELKDYDFVSIQNVGNRVEVNRFLACNTDAYLVDVNIQFEKAADVVSPLLSCDPIVPASELEETIREQMVVEEGDFAFSKFVCDPEMKKRSGYKVYQCWLRNAGDSPDKAFIYHLQEGRLAGFILFHVREDWLTVELVKVHSAYQGQGIARSLMTQLNAYAAQRGCRFLRVGTQLNNIPAVNLYHSLGYRDTARTSVFHVWNL